VFTLIGSEGKLFRPLAFTKTFALVAALIIALFLIPPFAAFIFKKVNLRKTTGYVLNSMLILLGLAITVYGYWIGILLIGFGITAFWFAITEREAYNISFYKFHFSLNKNTINIILSAVAIVFLLAAYWRPLGLGKGFILNLVFVGIICFGFLGIFEIFKKYYLKILNWALYNRLLFLMIPATLLVFGFYIFKTTGKEFMPSLNEGSFLLMPTSMPHAGVEENKRVLQQLDMAVAGIPEIETVVGKAGRTESALDPAPLSMYENMIQYKPEYMLNEKGERQRYKVNADGLFQLKDGRFVANPNNAVSSSAVENRSDISTALDMTSEMLVPDNDGELYRNWRPEIQSPDDIWNEIVKATKLPGVTSAPKLQPIETRLVMLQTGMRAPMGIKVKGQDLKQIQAFGIQLEHILKQVEGVKDEAVFADRIVGKPYLLIDIDRDKIARYGISIQNVQDVLSVAVGGMVLTQTVEGRERYGVRVRYPRELRADPTDLQQIYVPVEKGSPVPLSELATIRY